MIDVERVHDNLVMEPYRVWVDGEVLRNKKGQAKRFSTILKAFSYAQRYLERWHAEHLEIKVG